MPALTKNDIAADALRERRGVDAAARAHAIEHADRIGERERELLHRRRAGLLQVIAAHVRRIPLRQVRDAVLVGLRDQIERRLGREDVRAAREVLLDDVVLGRAAQAGLGHAAFARERDVEREQPHRGAVDRHRRVHLLERDAVEQHVHVVERHDRHADLADLGPRERMIGVVAALGRQIERDRQPGLPRREVPAVQLVRRARARVPRVGAKDPGLVARHRTTVYHRCLSPARSALRSGP